MRVRPRNEMSNDLICCLLGLAVTNCVPQRTSWACKPLRLSKPGGLKERVAERPVGFRGAIQVSYASLPRRLIDQAK